MIQFASLSLSPLIQQALVEEGYTTPTPIQAKAIPPALEGHDVLGVAQTGTGKTAAFALPILHRLLTAPVDKTRRGPRLPRALILAPTRELATQIAESFAVYGRHTGLDHAIVYGGVSQFHQVRSLHRGVDVLVATPGRLMDLMQQRVVNLSAVEFFVLDEADRMLDMGFIQPIRNIASVLPAKHQTMLFSATMPNEIGRLADTLMKNPMKVSVSAVSSAAPKVEQIIYPVGRDEKIVLLCHLIRKDNITKTVVFTRTKHGADRVARKLNSVGLTALAIHGNKAQNQRTRTLDSFKSGRTRILVATDVAARGLDVDGITHVFNYDLPVEAESYVHRIGRTARAGASGHAVSFCDRDERDELRSIERLLKKEIPKAKLPEDMVRDIPREEESEDHRFSRERAPSSEARPRQNRPSHAPGPRSNAASSGPAKSHSPVPHRNASQPRRAARPEGARPEGSRPEGAGPAQRSGHRSEPGAGAGAGPASRGRVTQRRNEREDRRGKPW